MLFSFRQKCCQWLISARENPKKSTQSSWMPLIFLVLSHWGKVDHHPPLWGVILTAPHDPGCSVPVCLGNAPLPPSLTTDHGQMRRRGLGVVDGCWAQCHSGELGWGRAGHQALRKVRSRWALGVRAKRFGWGTLPGSQEELGLKGTVEFSEEG